jgi:hypothetical protein
VSSRPAYCRSVPLSLSSSAGMARGTAPLLPPLPPLLRESEAGDALVRSLAFASWGCSDGQSLRLRPPPPLPRCYQTWSGGSHMGPRRLQTREKGTEKGRKGRPYSCLYGSRRRWDQR